MKKLLVTALIAGASYGLYRLVKYVLEPEYYLMNTKGKTK